MCAQGHQRQPAQPVGGAGKGGTTSLTARVQGAMTGSRSQKQASSAMLCKWAFQRDNRSGKRGRVGGKSDSSKTTFLRTGEETSFMFVGNLPWLMMIANLRLRFAHQQKQHEICPAIHPS